MIRYIAILCLLTATGCSFADGDNRTTVIDYEDTPFVFDSSRLTYKGKEFRLGQRLQDFEKIFGKYDRSRNDKIYTWDHAGIMAITSQSIWNPGSDTVIQINLVFHHVPIDTSSNDLLITPKEDSADWAHAKEAYDSKMELYRIRPRPFYRKGIRLNGVVLQPSMTIAEMNKALDKASIPTSFSKSWGSRNYKYSFYMEKGYADKVSYNFILSKDVRGMDQLEIFIPY